MFEPCSNDHATHTSIGFSGPRWPKPELYLERAFRGPLHPARPLIRNVMLKNMKALWTILNRPLVVALAAVTLTAALIYYGFNSLFGSIGGVNEINRDIDALGRLELIEFGRTEDLEGEPAKFVGQLKNHSPYVLSRVQGTICFWGSDGQLIDTYSKSLDGIGTLPPGEKRSFSLELTSSRGENFDVYVPDDPRTGPSAPAKVTLVFVDVDTLATE